MLGSEGGDVLAGLHLYHRGDREELVGCLADGFYRQLAVCCLLEVLEMG